MNSSSRPEFHPLLGVAFKCLNQSQCHGWSNLNVQISHFKEINFNQSNCDLDYMFRLDDFMRTDTMKNVVTRDWFTKWDAVSKRKEVANVIQQLTEDQNFMFPVLSFDRGVCFKLLFIFFPYKYFISAPSPTNFNSFMTDFWDDPAMDSFKPPKVSQKKPRRKAVQGIVTSKDQDPQQLLQLQLQQGTKCRKFYSTAFQNFWCRSCINKKGCKRC